MSKFIKTFSFFVFFFFLFFQKPGHAFGANCSLVTTPSPVVFWNNGNEVEVRYDITVADRNQNNIYKVIFQPGQVEFNNMKADSNGVLIFQDNYPLLVKPSNFGVSRGIFKTGSQTIKVERGGVRNEYCTIPYTIAQGIPTEENQIICHISGPKEANSSTSIIYTGTIEPSGDYRFSISGGGTNLFSRKFHVTSNKQMPAQDLGILNPNTYSVTLQKYFLEISQVGGDLITQVTQDVPKDTNCSFSQRIFSDTEKQNPDTTSAGVGASSPGTGSTQPPTKAAGISCNPDDPQVDPQTKLPTKDGPGIYTAIGCIPTEPTKLIAGLLKFALGVGGAIALLLMIYGAFLMITSSGNPEGVKKGQEQFTSAIVGLLFIIFSILLLQIIGVDVLNIPGFSK